MNTKMRVALFEKVGGYEWKTVWHASPDQTDYEADESQPDGYVRISPYVEVEFTPLQDESVILKHMEQLAKAEQQIREDFQSKLDRINDTRQKLMALTFRPAA